MNSKVIAVNVGERVRLAAAKVDTALAALSMAEAELRVWQSIEAEALDTTPVQAKRPKPATGWKPPEEVAGTERPVHASAKRNRRPSNQWMAVLGLLEKGPVAHADFVAAVAELGIVKRALIDQLRRYVGKLGLLVDDGSSYALTERAKRVLAAYSDGPLQRGGHKE